MKATGKFKDVVAWVIVAAAVVVAIGGATPDLRQQRFVECLETTRRAYPTATFDEMNAHCSGNRGILE